MFKAFVLAKVIESSTVVVPVTIEWLSLGITCLVTSTRREPDLDQNDLRHLRNSTLKTCGRPCCFCQPSSKAYVISMKAAAGFLFSLPSMFIWG